MWPPPEGLSSASVASLGKERMLWIGGCQGMAHGLNAACCVNKVLLERIHVHLSVYCLSRDHMACTAQYCPVSHKELPELATRDLGSCSSGLQVWGGP